MLLNELNKFSWDIIGLSETHWIGTDDRKYAQYRILHSGNVSEHRAGVGLFLNRNAEKALLSFTPVSERIITARFKTGYGYLAIIQVYAPTANANKKEIDEFYTDLQREVSKIPPADIPVIMGDLNAKIGKSEDITTNGVVGKHGYGKRNERGDMLADFCMANGLCITNTFFQQKKACRCWTWEAPGGERTQPDRLHHHK